MTQLLLLPAFSRLQRNSFGLNTVLDALQSLILPITTTCSLTVDPGSSCNNLTSTSQVTDHEVLSTLRVAAPCVQPIRHASFGLSTSIPRTPLSSLAHVNGDSCPTAAGCIPVIPMRQVILSALNNLEQRVTGRLVPWWPSRHNLARGPRTLGQSSL